MNAAIDESVELFTRMNILNQMSTGYQLIDMLLSTMIMLYLPRIFRNSKLYLTNALDYVSFMHYNKVTLEGLRTVLLGGWQTRTQNMFSLRFRALWHHIQKIQAETPSISAIKEYPASENSRDEYDEEDTSNYFKTSNDFYIVDQTKSFKLDKDIWCYVSKFNDDIEKTKFTSNQSFIVNSLKNNFSKIYILNDFQLLPLSNHIIMKDEIETEENII